MSLRRLNHRNQTNHINHSQDMPNWKEYRLGEIADVQNGYAFKSGEFANYGTPIIKIKNIVSPSVDLNDVAYYSNEIDKRLEKFIVKKKDFLISMTGSTVNQMASAVGKMGRYPFDTPSLINQRVGKIYSTSKKVSNEYLYYYLNRFEVQFDLATNASGSANQANISPDQIKAIKILLPDLSTQNIITEILSSLDDKIELNNQINKELEALAQALFKQWFIDFEFPNENGQPYKSSGGEMVESELGEIPKGWEVKKLDSIAELKKESVKPFEKPKNEFHHFSLPEFDTGKTPSIEIGEKILSSKYRVFPNSVLVSKLNPRIPRIWTIIDCDVDSICSTEFQVITPKNIDYFSFVNSICLSEPFIQSLQSKVTGTSSSHQRVNPKDIINYSLAIPQKEIIESYHSTIFPLLKLDSENRNESQKLTTLRDSLLPKLISGELEVSEVSQKKPVYAKTR